VSGVDFPVNEMIPVGASSVELGKPSDFPSYGWDNEYGNRKIEGEREFFFFLIVGFTLTLTLLNSTVILGIQTFDNER
jgi:hypothetical protein